MSKGDAMGYARDFSKKAIEIYNQSLGISAAKKQKKDKKIMLLLTSKESKEFGMKMSPVQQTYESPVMRKDASISIDIYNQSLGKRKKKKDAKAFVKKMSSIQQNHDPTLMGKGAFISKERKD